MPLLAALPHFAAFFGAILFGCAILLAVRILAGGEGERPDQLHQMLRRVAWQLITAGVLAVLFAAGLIPAIVTMIVFPAVVYRRRRAHRYALLAAIGVAVERRIPLIPVLSAFAAERKGFVARRTLELAARIQAGWSLPDAVDASRGLFPPHVRLAIRMGHDTGNLAGVIGDILEKSDSGDAVEAMITGKVLYFAVVSLLMLGVAVFVMMKIIPAMQKIFDEFGLDLPAMTILLVKLSYGFLNYWFLATPLFAAFLLFTVACVLRYVGVVQHDLPGTTWLRRRVHTAEILETLAMFTRANRPMTEAVSALAQWYPTGKIRRRLVHALDDIGGGRPWYEALARQRLISVADRGVLSAAQHVGNLSWASIELAESNRRRYAARAGALVQSAFVVVLLAYGALVCFFFVGKFLPLIKLISSLC